MHRCGSAEAAPSEFKLLCSSPHTDSQAWESSLGGRFPPEPAPFLMYPLTHRTAPLPLPRA